VTSPRGPLKAFATPRLSRVVIDPMHALFKIECEKDFRDAVVALLLDNSASIRGWPIMVAAMSAGRRQSHGRAEGAADFGFGARLQKQEIGRPEDFSDSTEETRL